MTEKTNESTGDAKTEGPKTKAAPAKKVRLATLTGEEFDLSGHGLGVVTSAGRDFTADEADTVRTLARKHGVMLFVKEN